LTALGKFGLEWKGMVEFELDWWGYCLEDCVGVSDACDGV